jgi:hypothetical protein
MEVTVVIFLIPAVAAGISAFCAQAREAKKRTEILTAIHETMAMAQLMPDIVSEFGPAAEHLRPFGPLLVTAQEEEILNSTEPNSEEFRRTAAYAAWRMQEMRRAKGQ